MKKYILTTITIVLTIINVIIFLFTNDNLYHKNTVTNYSKSNEIDLEIFNTDLDIRFVDKIGHNILGQYSKKKKRITIKCPENKSEMTKLYGTISHEATHYAMDLVERKGIEDRETTAYIVGYVTREIIKRNDCPINE